MLFGNNDKSDESIFLSGKMVFIFQDYKTMYWSTYFWLISKSFGLYISKLLLK